MSLSFLLAQANDATPAVDFLTKLTELLAAHGVYALVVFFLFYQQRRTFRDLADAKGENRPALLKIYKSTVVATYVLIVVAVPVWIYATFFYHPKTVLWGDVANLSQMAGIPQTPGEIYVDQQVTPEQRTVNFYENTQPDPSDTSKVTVYWALVEEGQNTEIPLVFSHRVKELVPSDANVPLDPNHPLQPTLKDIPQRKRFVVKLSPLATVPDYSFDYRYEPDAKDPHHTIGTLHLLRNGKREDVKMEDADARMPVSAQPSVLSWILPRSVFAQGFGKSQTDAATLSRMIPLLGSRDLKLQLAAEQTLSTAQTIPWDTVREVLSDSKSTVDHTLLVHNLAAVVTALSAKGVTVPADIRLSLAKESYLVSDFKTSTTFFNGLSEKDLSGDVTNYYYRGVSNLKTSHYDTAVKDLAKYANNAPNPGAKSVAQRTLSVASQKATAK